jgi:hypothetical protein
MLSSHAVAQSVGSGWRIFTNHEGTRVEYPAGLFAVDVTGSDTQGRVFKTRDGRATLGIFAFRNERKESPARYLRRAFPDDRGGLEYDRVAKNFFAVSGVKDGVILYRRCNFSEDGLVHCADIRYPASEKRAWDAAVTRISLSLRPR